MWQELSISSTHWLVVQQTATVWCTPIAFDIKKKSTRAVLQARFPSGTHEVALARVQTWQKFNFITSRTLNRWQMAGVWCAVNILWTIALSNFWIEEKSRGTLAFNTLLTEAHNISARNASNENFNHSLSTSFSQNPYLLQLPSNAQNLTGSLL